MWPFSFWSRKTEEAIEDDAEPSGPEFKRRRAPDGTLFIDWPCGCVTIKHVSADGTGTRKKRVPCEKHKPRGRRQS
jgi:hypothetical protein